MPTIKFTDTTGEVPVNYYPVPISKHLPSWLKELSPYYESPEIDYKPKQTAKRCLPMLDAAMCGYVILLTEDIRVQQTPDGPFYSWPKGEGIDFHPQWQASTHSQVHDPIPKWTSPWSIETPQGYSLLMTAPLNNPHIPIVPFSGIVETDSFNANVNFPFLLKDPNWEGIIEAGTPFVQLIPIRREAWTHSHSVGESPEIAAQKNLIRSSFLNAYRKLFRQGQSYR